MLLTDFPLSLAIGKLSHTITVLGSMAAKYDFLRKSYIFRWRPSWKLLRTTPMDMEIHPVTSLIFNVM